MGFTIHLVLLANGVFPGFRERGPRVYSPALGVPGEGWEIARRQGCGFKPKSYKKDIWNQLQGRLVSERGPLAAP